MSNITTTAIHHIHAVDAVHLDPRAQWAIIIVLVLAIINGVAENVSLSGMPAAAAGFLLILLLVVRIFYILVCSANFIGETACIGWKWFYKHCPGAPRRVWMAISSPLSPRWTRRNRADEEEAQPAAAENEPAAPEVEVNPPSWWHAITSVFSWQRRNLARLHDEAALQAADDRETDRLLADDDRQPPPYGDVIDLGESLGPARITPPSRLRAPSEPSPPVYSLYEEAPPAYCEPHLLHTQGRQGIQWE
jgi:hypothetical protein